MFYNLDNRKAIGIASNNLGNVLLTIGKSMATEQDEDFAALEYKTIRVKDSALQHFDEAVKIGQEEYENASIESKSEYCQQVRHSCLLQVLSIQELTSVCLCSVFFEAREPSFQQRYLSSGSLAHFERERLRIQ